MKRNLAVCILILSVSLCLSAQDNAALFTAIDSSNVQQVKSLIATGVDINATNKSGYTPLIYATKKGNLDIISMLVVAGADVNGKDTIQGDTPLIYATSRADIPTVTLLIEKGADINLQNDLNGDTPLIWAVKNNEIGIVKLLLDRGATPDQANNLGLTPLMLAESDELDKIVELLKQAGAEE